MTFDDDREEPILLTRTEIDLLKDAVDAYYDRYVDHEPHENDYDDWTKLLHKMTELVKHD